MVFHLWRVKLKNIIHSPEYRDILGTGEQADDLRNILSTYKTEIEICDKVIELANAEVTYDAGYMEGGHLYVDEKSEDTSRFIFPMMVHPNGISIVGSGSSMHQTVMTEIIS